jgi:HPt (histidine-containing phosphotransfer) domain-containing protein
MPDEQECIAFATQAHALKSAAATIGAAGLAAEAARLEAAGKAGDTVLVREGLPVFHKHLTELVEGIGKALEEEREEISEGSQDRDGEKEALAALAADLQAALEAKNMKEIDRLVEKIEQLPLDKETREAINLVSDKTLLGEYEGAIETITALLAAKES